MDTSKVTVLLYCIPASLFLLQNGLHFKIKTKTQKLEESRFQKIIINTSDLLSS